MTAGYPADDVEEVDQVVAIPWSQLRDTMKLDARGDLLLWCFEDRFDSPSSIEAFAQIPTFLGEYMIREFDYRKFCTDLGTMSEESADDVTAWTQHMAENLTSDLVAASSLMLRLAMTIAKAHQLEPADWKDINDACSNAVRSLPACYRLQRALPGALSVARTWRHIPEGPEERGNGSPWDSEELQATFEEMYHFPWSRIQALCTEDEKVVGAFSGRFQVLEVNAIEEISLVNLEAVNIRTPPPGFPASSTSDGDVVLLEVETSLGSLLEPGFFIEADFYEISNKTCFISSLRFVAPSWTP